VERARSEAPRVSVAATRPGEALFQASCSACHGATQRVVGPPLTEIARLYAGNPQGIVSWAHAPGKKRADYPQMPPFAALGDDTLLQIAGYMIELGTSPPP
jgi:cytochrome c